VNTNEILAIATMVSKERWKKKYIFFVVIGTGLYPTLDVIYVE
jgi:branched-subunit amino acid transport protein AzlD